MPKGEIRIGCRTIQPRQVRWPDHSKTEPLNLREPRCHGMICPAMPWDDLQAELHELFYEPFEARREAAMERWRSWNATCVREWKRLHPERVKELAARYRERNRDRIRASDRARYRARYVPTPKTPSTSPRAAQRRVQRQAARVEWSEREQYERSFTARYLITRFK